MKKFPLTELVLEKNQSIVSDLGDNYCTLNLSLKAVSIGGTQVMKLQKIESQEVIWLSNSNN